MEKKDHEGEDNCIDIDGAIQSDSFHCKLHTMIKTQGENRQNKGREKLEKGGILVGKMAVCGCSESGLMVTIVWQSNE